MPAFLNNPTALIAVVLILLLLFGGKNIPEMMKGMGQGMREFKKGMEQDEEEPNRAHVSPDQEAEIEAEVLRRIKLEKEVRARLKAEK